MKGGMRFGAGRPSNRRKTWQVQRLDVYRMASSGRIAADANALNVAYSFPFADGVREVRDYIRIVRRPCTLGGTRALFTCPRCGRDCAVIYCNGWPACNRCAKLAYQSQSEDAIARSWRRTRRIETRLGWRNDAPHRRPKGMRSTTFECLRATWWREVEYRDAEMARFMAWMLARHPSLAGALSGF